MCAICRCKFQSQTELETHQQQEHPEYWNVKQIEKSARYANTSCTVCGKQFTQKHKLEKHMHTHTGTSPFYCEICGQGVASTTNLKRHMLTHTKAYPFRCEICDMGFRDENKYMEVHCKMKHPGEYEQWRMLKEGVKVRNQVMNSL